MKWAIKLLLTILVTSFLLLPSPFISGGHGATTTGWYKTITGNYHLIKASLWEVQNVWDSRSDLDLDVVSFSDIKRKEIWYTSEASLRYEKWVVESWDNVWEERRLNRRASKPFWNW